MRRWFAFAAVSCLIVVVLAACAGGEEGPAAPTATPVPTDVPTPPAPVPVGEVVWSLSIDGTSGAPGEPLTTLPNSAPRVFAAVHADELPASSRIVARWSINGTPLPELDPAPVEIDAGRADAWISWSLTWTSDQPWPIATLGIDVEVNGKVMSTGEILIVRDRAADE